jgi:hypothetical protein
MNDQELTTVILNSNAYKECKNIIKDKDKMIEYVKYHLPAFDGEDVGLIIDGLVSVYASGRLNNEG